MLYEANFACWTRLTAQVSARVFSILKNFGNNKSNFFHLLQVLPSGSRSMSKITKMNETGQDGKG